MTRRERRLVQIGLIVVGALFACDDEPPGPPPNDQQLIAELQNNRAKYDTLLAMFLADSALGRVAHTFTRPANFFSGGPLPTSAPITEARLAEYRRLFDELSLPDGIEVYDQKGTIYFWRYSSGFGAGLGGSGRSRVVGLCWRSDTTSGSLGAVV